MEECTVELLSAMIGADLNLSVELRPYHASYVASWLKVLRSRQARHRYHREQGAGDR